ncbi:MAG: glycosyltransferase [Candidatus Brocadiia bacterium]
MRIVLAHTAASADRRSWYEEIAGAAGEDLDVRPFCVTLDPPGPRLNWPELDRLWRDRDRRLMRMYRALRKSADDADVLLVYNGANVHPGLLECLPTYNVYCCFDDPESSHLLSAPVAAAFDAAFYGNIASRFQYEHWGCERLAHLPVFTAPSDVPPPGEEQALLERRRDVDMVFVGEKNRRREGRLEALAEAFPQARCYGRGWPEGRVGEERLRELYRRARIGWNVHNSTGPINRRLFALAAFGVLPICDNRTGLGQLFRLGEEAVGFDTIPEAVELTRYYLHNEDERQRIARNAYRRFWQDYHVEALWARIRRQLERWMAEEDRSGSDHPPKLLPQRGPKQAVKSLLCPHYRRARRMLGRIRSVLRAPGARPSAGSAVQRPWRDVDERHYLGQRVEPYSEGGEMPGVNMARQRLAEGLPLDWPNMLAQNWAITSLVRDAERIVEIGSGTGPFAWYASVVPGRRIDAFEQDDFARQKAVELRSRDGVHYIQGNGPEAGADYDLLVAGDVVEHVRDLPGFLRYCASVAPRAILTTPNRDVVRADGHAGPPPYPPHVREFDAGEFYWVLRLYYRRVFLYHMPDYYVPWLEPMTIADTGHPIVAECVEPLAEEQ